VGRRPKLYVPLTVTFFEDDRIIEAGDAATLLYLELCVLAKRSETDGTVARSQLSRVPRAKRMRELAALVDVGLVTIDEHCVRIVDWLDFNESLAEADARRAIDRFRKELSEDVRREVYSRDGYRCVICGSSDQLSIDHIVPVSLGGTHDLENLQTLCIPCNSRKGDRPA
jgi:5-methylcytosine-specific restriction endonuclease McrA